MNRYTEQAYWRPVRPPQGLSGFWCWMADSSGDNETWEAR
jgi:hypothetical protein